MVVDNLFCIRHAAVADLYGITIENFSEFAVVGEAVVVANTTLQ